MKDEARSNFAGTAAAMAEVKRAPTFTAADMRATFTAGAAFERAHQFMPPEIRPAKAAEEAAANWPD